MEVRLCRKINTDRTPHKHGFLLLPVLNLTSSVTADLCKQENILCGVTAQSAGIWAVLDQTSLVKLTHVAITQWDHKVERTIGTPWSNCMAAVAMLLFTYFSTRGLRKDFWSWEQKRTILTGGGDNTTTLITFLMVNLWLRQHESIMSLPQNLSFTDDKCPAAALND